MYFLWCQFWGFGVKSNDIPQVLFFNLFESHIDRVLISCGKLLLGQPWNWKSFLNPSIVPLVHKHTYYVDTLLQSQIDGQLVFMKIKVVSFSSAIVAEVTQPSLGVGYEIGRAFEKKKKILCLFRPDSGKRRFTYQPNVLFWATL